MSAAARPTCVRSSEKYRKSDEMAARITELYAYITAADYQFLVLVAEFDRHGYWELGGIRSCAHWLNWQCGIGMNAAREKVRVARALEALPKISKAFARGEISYSKVRAMTRVANADNEDYLLHFARHGTAYHVEKLVAGFRRAKRLQAAEGQNVRRHREVATRWDDDGCLVVTARLPAEQGAVLLKALELGVDRQFDAERETKDTTADPVYFAADATDTTDAAAAAAAADPAGAAETSNQAKPTHAMRRADALAEMAEAYLAHEAPKGSAGDRYQVVVHVTAETPGAGAAPAPDVSRPEQDPRVAAETAVTDRLPGPGTPRLDSRTPVSAETAVTGLLPGPGMPRLDGGPRVSAETSRRIGCDSAIVPMFRNIRGEPLSVGRKTRAIPPPILRALWVRDGGCRFPGCTNARFADGHHVKHWADGGETRLDNLVLLCRHHHGLVHEGGFACERNRQGHVVFRSPRGNVIPDAFELTAPAAVREPVAWLAGEFDCEHIDAQTCVTKWQGERCDWDMAVGHFFDGLSSAPPP